MSQRKVKAALISLPAPPIEDDSRQPPGGLVSIATYARNKGYEVSVFDLAGMSAADVCENIPYEGINVYGFSVYSVTSSITRQTILEVHRRSPHAVIVAGGPHATALPHDIADSVDHVVCGEGEEAFLNILSAIQNGQGKLLPKVIRAGEIVDLNQLPFPDYEDLCDMGRYTRRLEGVPVMSLDSSRGCNFRCRFCNSCVVERGRWRARTPESMASEVRWHYEQGWKGFRFNDDNFLADPSRASTFCELVKPLCLKFRIFARAESLADQALCDRLAAAGCRHVGVGIESLSPVMLGKMGKSTLLERVRKGLIAAHNAGLLLRGYFIVGFPGETDLTVSESIGRLADLPLDDAVVYPCIPYPGTKLFKNPTSFGITWIDSDFSHYVQVGRSRSAGFVMRTETFGPEEVKHWRDQYMDAFRSLGIAWSSTSTRIV